MAKHARRDEQATRRRGGRRVAARSLALFIGAFSLANALGYALGHSANQNIWWIDFSWLSTWIGGAAEKMAVILECLVGIALVAWAVRPQTDARRRAVTVALLAVMAAFAAQNVVSYWQLLLDKVLWHALPVPFSVLVVAALVWLACAVARSETVAPDDAGTRTGIVIGALVVALVFPLLQIGFFGTTDYRRASDVAIVLGAQVHSDGTPSMALSERLDTAIELYRQGCVGTLVMSGGQGSDEPVNEVDAMRDYAVANGVPESAILLDPQGNSTEATVADTVPLISAHGWKSEHLGRDSRSHGAHLRAWVEERHRDQQLLSHATHQDDVSPPGRGRSDRTHRGRRAERRHGPGPSARDSRLVGVLGQGNVHRLGRLRRPPHSFSQRTDYVPLAWRRSRTSAHAWLDFVATNASYAAFVR